jgi:hypothetical protein
MLFEARHTSVGNTGSLKSSPDKIKKRAEAGNQDKRSKIS